MRSALALVVAFIAATGGVRGQSLRKVPVSIRVAIVGDDRAVTPVPQAGFLVVGARGDTTRLETDLAGIARGSLPPGHYSVASAGPVRVGAATYSWHQTLSVGADAPALELTQRNAETYRVAAEAAAPIGARRVSEEAGIYERIRAGVFTVFGAEGQGSGFLVDRRGLVLTNAHVIAGTESDRVRVQLDGATSVAARVLSADKDRDVAVLGIAPARAADRPMLPLAAAAPEALAVAGERVLAVGSPLHQTGVLTIGIVSRVEPRAIISDVLINHGNSGGPLLNLDGQVIAINTFGDANEQGGPGIAGSILITEAKPALAAARDSVSALGYGPPAATLLPVLDPEPYPVEALRAAAAADRYDLKAYAFDAGPFRVTIMTPPVMAWVRKQELAAVSADRKKREARAGVSANERVDAIQNWYSWEEYVGERKPGVVLQVSPRIGQTKGSLLGSIVAGAAAVYSGGPYLGHARYVFKGDFRRLSLQRDGEEVAAVEDARLPAVLDFDELHATGKDLAYQGVSVFRPDVFRPRADGTSPALTLIIQNTAKPTEPTVVTLSARSVEAIWRDFAPYHAGGSVACGDTLRAVGSCSAAARVGEH